MKGINLAKEFFEKTFKETLEKDFKDVLDLICVALVGSGSECYGFDDDISQDHDFEPGFCVFVPSTISSDVLFKLEKAYAKLPKTFKGLKRETDLTNKRHGIILIEDFYKEKINHEYGFTNKLEWFNIKEHFLKEATNGCVFFDNFGLFTSIRNSLKEMPKDVWLKKLAGHLLLMHQAGHYNYQRMQKRNDLGGMALAKYEYVIHALNVIYLLNNEYMPFYKWAFRGLDEVKILKELKEPLLLLLNSSFDDFDAVSSKIIETLKEQNLTNLSSLNLDFHARVINDKIKDVEIRNLDILYGVE